MQLLNTLFFIGLAEAATNFTLNGVTVTVTRAVNGVEVPAGYTVIDYNSTMLNAKSNSRSRAKRDDPIASRNWCGAIENAPSGETWVRVQGAWNVPTLSLRSGQSLNSNPAPGAASWIDMDGTNGCSSITQAGVISTLSTTGAQINTPIVAVDQGAAMALDFPVNNGDAIVLVLTKTSETSVTFNIGDFSNGQSAVVRLSNVDAICGGTVEWIMEAFTAGSEVPLANFNAFAFQNAKGETNTGTTFGSESASGVEMIQNNEIVCEALVDPNNPIVGILA